VTNIPVLVTPLVTVNVLCTPFPVYVLVVKVGCALLSADTVVTSINAPFAGVPSNIIFAPLSE